MLNSLKKRLVKILKNLDNQPLILPTSNSHVRIIKLSLENL